MRKIFLFIAAMCCTVMVNAEIIEGDCGMGAYNLSYRMDTETGYLQFLGKGVMKDYSQSNLPPWNQYLTHHIDFSTGEPTNIGDYAFYRTKAIGSVDLIPSILTIGAKAFYASNLTNINLSNVVLILDQAFEDCDNLTALTFPKTLEVLGDEAFADCDNLTALTFPSSLNTIGDWAFNSCDELTTVSIAAGLKSLNAKVFYECMKMRNITVASGNPYLASQDNVVYNRNKTHLIYCPQDKQDKEFVIPNTVTHLDDYAMNKCHNIQKITIPASVTNIGEYVFSGCSSLTAIVNKAAVPQTISTSFDPFGDFDYTAVTLYVPAGCANAYRAAEWWKKFKNIVEETPTTLNGSCGETMTWTLDTQTGVLNLDHGGDMYDYDYDNLAPWYDCRALITRVSTWDSPTSIGAYAFFGCENLTNVSLSSSITRIGNYAFEYCRILESINLPYELETIGEYAFHGCDKLSYLYIPMSVTNIASGAFYEAGISEFEVSENNENYCSANKLLFDKSKKTVVAYPIANTCTDYTVPAGVQTIEEYAFGYSQNLTHVDLPESLSLIKWSAFYACQGLTSITCHAVTPPMLENTSFEYVDTSIPVYVPKESVEAYKASTWNLYFSDFLPIGTEGIERAQRTEHRAQKIIRDGQLFIERNGKAFNAVGAEVR